MEPGTLSNWRYHAEGWAANGFDLHTATRWRAAGFRSWEAKYWAAAGLYPDEAWSAKEAGLDWEMAGQFSGLSGLENELAAFDTHSNAHGETVSHHLATYTDESTGHTDPIVAKAYTESAGGIGRIAAKQGSKIAILVMMAVTIAAVGLISSQYLLGNSDMKSTPPEAVRAHDGIAQVMLDINPPPLYGKPKPGGGVLQDAYVPAIFSVKSREHVDVTVTNFSTDAHSFTSTPLHLNVTIHPGAHAHPRATTFQFIAPKPGIYYWHCIMPCGWGMHHLGYMMGEVVVTS